MNATIDTPPLTIIVRLQVKTITIIIILQELLLLSRDNSFQNYIIMTNINFLPCFLSNLPKTPVQFAITSAVA